MVKRYVFADFAVFALIGGLQQREFGQFGGFDEFFERKLEYQFQFQSVVEFGPNSAGGQNLAQSPVTKPLSGQ